MSINASREQRRQLDIDNAKYPQTLIPVRKDQWPASIAAMKSPPFAVWRSRKFLVQGFIEGNGITRLSINRTTLGEDGRWLEGITWDEIQNIKKQVGLGEYQAVEVYPADRDVVNVANMRHLWVLREMLPFGWRKS